MIATPNPTGPERVATGDPRGLYAGDARAIGNPTAIVDTVRVGPGETMVDFIAATLEAGGG